MEESVAKNWRGRILKGLQRGNNRVKLLFLLLSLMLWFLIKLSKGGYVSEIQFSVDYTDLPQNQVFTKDPPASLRLRLRGTGFSLLKYAWFNYRSLEIDLDKLQLLEANRYYWLSENGVTFLESQINNEDVRVLSVEPDTLYFHISRLSKQRIPVQLRLKVAFDSSQYALYKRPLIEPDSVEVWGPEEQLANLTFIPTDLLRVQEAKDSMRFSIGLNPPELQYLRLDREAVQVGLNYSPLTEGKLSIPILVLNVPDSLRMEVFPSEAQIQYRCTLRDFKDIRPDEFFIYADYQEIANKPDAQFISLRYEQPPKEVRSLNLLTKRVEFILSKR